MARKIECQHTEQFIICFVCDDEGDALGARDISTIETMVRFKAQFDSQCGWCPDPIYEDERATLVVYDDDNKVSMHDECAQRAKKEAV